MHLNPAPENVAHRGGKKWRVARWEDDGTSRMNSELHHNEPDFNRETEHSL